MKLPRPHWPRIGAIAFSAAVWSVAGAACADPCIAPVTGFKPGQVISGTVVYAGDGDSLCVGTPAKPLTWVEIRLGDFYAPELHQEGGKAARDALAALALGRKARCVAHRSSAGPVRSYDRIVARCFVDGVSLGDSLRASGIAEGGRGFSGAGR